MKTVLISLIFSFATITSFAQINTNSKTHLKFKGVPIDGTQKEFVTKMEQVGFEEFGTVDGVTLLKGDFAGYKDCFVGVSTLKNKDLVSVVSVLFVNQYTSFTWSDLSGIYFDLKELLSEKYGKPSDIVEKFQRSEPFIQMDDNEKIYQVKMNRCDFSSVYEMDNGTIELSIESIELETAVRLTYRDKINSEQIRKHAIDDL